VTVEQLRVEQIINKQLQSQVSSLRRLLDNSTVRKEVVNHSLIKDYNSVIKDDFDRVPLTFNYCEV